MRGGRRGFSPIVLRIQTTWYVFHGMGGIRWGVRRMWIHGGQRQRGVIHPRTVSLLKISCVPSIWRPLLPMRMVSVPIYMRATRPPFATHSPHVVVGMFHLLCPLGSARSTLMTGIFLILLAFLLIRGFPSFSSTNPSPTRC